MLARPAPLVPRPAAMILPSAWLARRTTAAARRTTVLALLALLAAMVALTGCSLTGNGPPGQGRGDGSPRAAGAGRAADPLAAMRAGLRHPGRRTAYYLSLGDSLSQGVQPALTGRNVPTARGYPDRLVARLRHRLPRLRLVKLGCSGETTATMIRGGTCRYLAGSQLDQAIRFLRSHRGKTALITIDIGANDPNSCVTSRSLNSILPCLAGRIPQAGRNLNTILTRLRLAAGRGVLIVGMTYYVPELGLWRTGRDGRRIAILTGAVVAGANRMLANRYHRHGARVADVFLAFRSSDFAVTVKKAGQAGNQGHPGRAGHRPVPPNVTAICSLTWMCARPPRGPNEHANDAGYGVIARAFWRAIAAR